MGVRFYSLWPTDKTCASDLSLWARKIWTSSFSSSGPKTHFLPSLVAAGLIWWNCVNLNQTKEVLDAFRYPIVFSLTGWMALALVLLSFIIARRTSSFSWQKIKTWYKYGIPLFHITNNPCHHYFRLDLGYHNKKLNKCNAILNFSLYIVAS